VHVQADWNRANGFCVRGIFAFLEVLGSGVLLYLGVSSAFGQPGAKNVLVIYGYFNRGANPFLDRVLIVCQYLICSHAGQSSRIGKLPLQNLRMNEEFVGAASAIVKNYYEGAVHSMRKACTGSMEAARRAGMMPAMAAASTSTPMAMIMTGTFTLVIS
jgi:hypothetical protein